MSEIHIDKEKFNNSMLVFAEAAKIMLQGDQKDVSVMIRNELLKIYNDIEEDILLDSEESSIGIYQLKEEFLHQYGFESIDRLKRYGLIDDDTQIVKDKYDLVYVMDRDKKTLDDVYMEFNVNHPADFLGHSLSVGDVVALAGNGKITAHFVDSYGFKRLPNFFHEKERKIPFEKLVNDKLLKEKQEKAVKGEVLKERQAKKDVLE